MTPSDAASILPRKTFDCEFKEIDESTGSFAMYALVFGNVDRGGDRIRQGAVKNLDELIRDGWIALNHDQKALPVASIDSAVQDDHGLLIHGTFHSTPDAQACRTIVKERMARGKAVKTSIGYMVLPGGEEYERVNNQSVRDLNGIGVYEASFVNLPMNPLAEVQTVKSFEGLDNSEGDEEMSDAAVVKALKRVLGLATKSSYKVDGEDMEKAKGLANKLGDTAKGIADCHKSMKGLIDSHKATSEEFVKCMKSFTSGQQEEPEAGDENEGDDAEGEPAAEKPKPKEEEEPKPKAKKKEEEEEPEEDKTKKAYREQLRKRALLSRREQVCP